MNEKLLLQDNKQYKQLKHTNKNLQINLPIGNSKPMETQGSKMEIGSLQKQHSILSKMELFFFSLQNDY